MAGVDESGPHVVETGPDGHVAEYAAWAIGGRSQSARSYLEKVGSAAILGAASAQDLVRHGLRALKEAAPKSELEHANVSVGVVEVGGEFIILGEAEVNAVLEQLREEDSSVGAGSMEA